MIQEAKGWDTFASTMGAGLWFGDDGGDIGNSTVAKYISSFDNVKKDESHPSCPSPISINFVSAEKYLLLLFYGIRIRFHWNLWA